MVQIKLFNIPISLLIGISMVVIGAGLGIWVLFRIAKQGRKDRIFPD